MNHKTTKSDEAESENLPKPRFEKRDWPYNLVWLVPLFAAGLACYLYDRLDQHGPLITIRVSDATGLSAGQTLAMHLGVQIGKVTAVELTPDQKQVEVKIRLQHSAEMFARKGAVFWVVRAEISAQQISGLGTVLSGPVIDSLPAPPGTTETQTEFTSLETPPAPMPDGLNIVLKATNVERLQIDSPVYYRGIQVGFIKEVHLSPDAASVDLNVRVRRRYAPLVRSNSEFWIVPAVDMKGGIFTGFQMKVESLRALISGGVAFATPDENMGEPVNDGAIYLLHDEVKKDWLKWTPSITVGPSDSDPGNKNPTLPQPPQAIRSAVGTK